MNYFLLLLLAFSLTSSYAQTNIDKQKKEILAEGMHLYRSEMASWYGTDLFLPRYENKENIGGYLSYTENENAICIFFSKKPNPQILGTITFNQNYELEQALVDLKTRDFTKKELDLYTLRQAALEDIVRDTLYKRYQNTQLNLVPLIHGKEKKVYILTGPSTSGVVIFGNDYLITFNKDNTIRSRKQLHKNIIPIHTNETEDGHLVRSTVHSHLPETGHLPTATDICTLLLYTPFTTWESHIIVSDKYSSIWDCKKNDLLVLSNEVIDKINQHQDAKNKD